MPLSDWSTSRVGYFPLKYAGQVPTSLAKSDHVSRHVNAGIAGCYRFTIFSFYIFCFVKGTSLSFEELYVKINLILCDKYCKVYGAFPASSTSDVIQGKLPWQNNVMNSVNEFSTTKGKQITGWPV